MARTLSLKLVDDGGLSERADQRGVSRTELSRRYVDEGLRMDAHPGLVYRDGHAGRRAALAAAPDVWQVIDLARAFAGDGPAGGLQRTADWLDLPPGDRRYA